MPDLTPFNQPNNIQQYDKKTAKKSIKKQYYSWLSVLSVIIIFILLVRFFSYDNSHQEVNKMVYENDELKVYLVEVNTHKNLFGKPRVEILWKVQAKHYSLTNFNIHMYKLQFNGVPVDSPRLEHHHFHLFKTHKAKIIYPDNDPKSIKKSLKVDLVITHGKYHQSYNIDGIRVDIPKP